MSSGAAIVAAIEVAKWIEKGVIVAILPDREEKYLRTDLFGTPARPWLPSVEECGELCLRQHLNARQAHSTSLQPSAILMRDAI
jgi:hypothetical protein